MMMVTVLLMEAMRLMAIDKTASVADPMTMVTICTRSPLMRVRWMHGTGNNADTDDDGDGIADTSDAFPLDASETIDTDADGIGNNADPDDDGDDVAKGVRQAVDTDLDGTAITQTPMTMAMRSKRQQRPLVRPSL